MPDEGLASIPIPSVVPDLAVEVISPGNTASEMERKLREYFGHGVRLVWLIDPKNELATVYHSPTESQVIRRGESLEGEDVLPGFSLPLGELFDRDKKRPKKG